MGNLESLLKDKETDAKRGIKAKINEVLTADGTLDKNFKKELEDELIVLERKRPPQKINLLTREGFRFVMLANDEHSELHNEVLDSGVIDIISVLQEEGLGLYKRDLKYMIWSHSENLYYILEGRLESNIKSLENKKDYCRALGQIGLFDFMSAVDLRKTFGEGKISKKEKDRIVEIIRSKVPAFIRRETLSDYNYLFLRMVRDKNASRLLTYAIQHYCPVQNSSRKITLVKDEENEKYKWCFESPGGRLTDVDFDDNVGYRIALGRKNSISVTSIGLDKRKSETLVRHHTNKIETIGIEEARKLINVYWEDLIVKARKDSEEYEELVYKTADKYQSRLGLFPCGTNKTRKGYKVN